MILLPIRAQWWLWCIARLRSLWFRHVWSLPLVFHEYVSDEIHSIISVTGLSALVLVVIALSSAHWGSSEWCQTSCYTCSWSSGWLQGCSGCCRPLWSTLPSSLHWSSEAHVPTQASALLWEVSNELHIVWHYDLWVCTSMPMTWCIVLAHHFSYQYSTTHLKTYRSDIEWRYDGPEWQWCGQEMFLCSS